MNGSDFGQELEQEMTRNESLAEEAAKQDVAAHKQFEMQEEPLQSPLRLKPKKTKAQYSPNPNYYANTLP
eukprot:1905012-Amphidinium_carterae.1